MSPIGVLRQTLDLFTRTGSAVLVYNEQTSGAETDKVLAAAQQNAGAGRSPSPRPCRSARTTSAG